MLMGVVAIEAYFDRHCPCFNMEIIVMSANKHGYSYGTSVIAVRGNEYSLPQTTLGFLAIFGAVLAVAWGMSNFPNLKV